MSWKKRHSDGQAFVVKSHGKKLTSSQVKLDLQKNARPFKYPAHQVKRMKTRELINAKKGSDKTIHFEKIARKSFHNWGLRPAVDDLNDPKEGAVIFDYHDENDYGDDDKKRNAVPVGSWDGFFESMWGERFNDVKKTGDAEIKQELLEETMNNLVNRDAPDDYLDLVDGEYYLVREK